MLNDIAIQVSPDFTGRICLYMENGKLKANRPVREDEHIASLLTFIELAQAAGYQVEAKEVSDGRDN